MKTITSFILFSLIIVQALAQQVPLIKVGEDQLGVAKIDIQLDVVGNIATTTYDMYFYNPTNEVLEGELVFPLGEQQSVSRFALDVFGTLREAVVVEKEKGRIAFEAVVRRRVDPALLEKGTGNNYRARIYPIPAKGYKRVLLAYEEPLQFTEGSHFVTIPHAFKNELEAYSLQINVANQSVKPYIRSGNRSLMVFEAAKNDYVLQKQVNNYHPTEDVRIEIPLGNDVKVSTYKDYNYVYTTLDEVRPLRAKPKKIQLFWDISLSMKDRNQEKEFDFLEAYFKTNPNLEVVLSTFSNTLDQQQYVKVANGDWSMLKQLLSLQRYDGATAFSVITKHVQEVDQVLLFSDGLSTLSELPQQLNKPTFIVNSIQKANHVKNASLAQESDAAYLNLVDISSEEAMEKLQYIPLVFMGIAGKNNIEFYPKAGTPLFKDFALALKGDIGGKTLQLQFGSNGKVINTIEVDIHSEENSTAQTSRLWAQKKVAYLQMDSENNNRAITQLGKEFQLVTDHTSLIVLETLRDYETYGIDPPKELLELTSNSRRPERNPREGELAETAEPISENEAETVRSVETAAITTAAAPGSTVTVSGMVVDNNGLPLPGVNIVVAGTSTGTQSDFDGKYQLSMRSGEDLIFSYVGFTTLETTVGGSGTINIEMVEAADALSEVIVTAQGIKKEVKAIGYAVSTVESEDIEQRSEGDVARVLSGKASGVNIQSQSGTSGSATNVIIRGYNSISGNNQALFIVDGVPFSNDTNTSGSFLDGNVGSSRLLDLDPNNIESVRVLKGLAAATLYGTQGRNGVILITTKTASSAPNASSGSSSYRAPSNPNKVTGIDRSILKRERTIAEKGILPSYIIPFKGIATSEEIYRKYLSMRHAYSTSPAFFVDVYDYLKAYDANLANKVLSNIAEIDLDNYELLKVLAYKYEEQGNLELAAYMYRKVLKLRPEDAQSYRDLALVLIDQGHTEEGKALLQPLVDVSLYAGTRRRVFDGLREIATTELRHINQGVAATEADIRVVVDWNHNDTDIDLQIIDPKFEKCWYHHPTTSSNGMLSDDMTEGFGPETFVQKKARNGTYYVKVNYFDDRYQKIENPTFMKVTIYRNYGRADETKEVSVVRLSNSDTIQLVKRIEV